MIVAGTTSLWSRYPHDGIAANIVWPVTLAQLKSHAQIRHHTEDDFLVNCIADATEYVEQRGQVSLIEQKLDLWLDYWPAGQTIQAHRGPLIRVDNVLTIDPDGQKNTAPSFGVVGYTERIVPSGLYFFAHYNPPLFKGLPSVRVRTVCGYGTTPDSVPMQWRTLVCAVATHSYERRELASGGGFDEAFERVLHRKFIAAGRNERYV